MFTQFIVSDFFLILKKDKILLSLGSKMIAYMDILFYILLYFLGNKDDQLFQWDVGYFMSYESGCN